MHHHAHLQLVELAAEHGITREAKLGRVVDLYKAVVLIREQAHYHAALAGTLVWLDLVLLDIAQPLQLALDGVEGVVERGRVVLLRLAPLLLVSADNG